MIAPDADKHGALLGDAAPDLGGRVDEPLQIARRNHELAYVDHRDTRQILLVVVDAVEADAELGGVRRPNPGADETVNVPYDVGGTRIK